MFYRYTVLWEKKGLCLSLPPKLLLEQNRRGLRSTASDYSIGYQLSNYTHQIHPGYATFQCTQNDSITTTDAGNINTSNNESSTTLHFTAYCAEYNEKGLRIQTNFEHSCSQADVPCPSHYSSDVSHRYQQCYHLDKKMHHPNRSFPEQAGPGTTSDAKRCSMGLMLLSLQFLLLWL
ncbi:uncharacterized protein LOC125675327 isoform X2 [Ostrea edulis]|uniref:uncharacterized protein LOC125675327 isoform X2 n=1 Tax=Ostrea edulis TaxID=37623 RepID=UPI0024AF7BF8|nr:uncharacterized protein LOC125675327 isoform X2 [Ostrea edulis]